MEVKMNTPVKTLLLSVTTLAFLAAVDLAPALAQQANTTTSSAAASGSHLQWQPGNKADQPGAWILVK
jgi:hypothetical protein